MSIDEKDFGRIQKDCHDEMHYWANELKRSGVGLSIVAANNHYAGYGRDRKLVQKTATTA